MVYFFDQSLIYVLFVLLLKIKVLGLDLINVVLQSNVNFFPTIFQQLQT